MVFVLSIVFLFAVWTVSAFCLALGGLSVDSCLHGFDRESDNDCDLRDRDA